MYLQYDNFISFAFSAEINHTVIAVVVPVVAVLVIFLIGFMFLLRSALNKCKFFFLESKTNNSVSSNNYYFIFLQCRKLILDSLYQSMQLVFGTKFAVFKSTIQKKMHSTYWTQFKIKNLIYMWAWSDKLLPLLKYGDFEKWGPKNALLIKKGILKIELENNYHAYKVHVSYYSYNYFDRVCSKE